MSSEAVVTSDAASVPSDGTPAAQPVQDTKGDFEQRVKTDPEFALAQVKEAQRRLTQYQTKFGKDVEQVVDAVGGKDALMGHLRRLNTIVSNPAMRQLVEEFERTGTLPTRAAVNQANNTATADADDYEEPWTRDLRQSQQEVASLRAELNSLRGERGVEKVRGLLQEFETSMGLTPEESADLREKLIEHANHWGQNEQGLQVLKSMDKPTFRSLALGKLSDETIEAAALRRAEARRNQRSAAATDSPSGVRTQARPEPATGLSPKDAFIKACQDIGQDPWKPLV